MTNEKMLEIAIHARTLAQNGDLEALLNLAENTRLVLQEDIRHECLKAKGLAKRDKLAAKVFDEIPDNRPLLKGWQPTKDGKVAICSPYRIYATDETFGYAQATEQLQIVDHIFPRKETLPLQIDPVEVKAYIKEQKAEVKAWNAEHPKNKRGIKPMAFEVEDYSRFQNIHFRIGADPQKLLEFLQFFNTSTVYVTGPTDPIQYRDMETGDWGVLLPCRLKG